MSELARHVRARREALRLAQADLAGKGGPKAATVRRVERAEVPGLRAQTKTQLEQALGWERGLIDRIVDGTATEEEIYGGEPAQRQEQPQQAAGDDLDRQRAQFERGLRADPDLSNLTLAALLLERLERPDQARTPRVVELVDALKAALSELNPRSPARQAVDRD